MRTHQQRTRAVTMVDAVCAALTIMAAVRPARGEESAGARPAPAAITLVDPGTAPFSSGELSQALLARLTGAADVTPPQVRVAGAGGVVTVEVGDRSRRVELGDRTGPAAARIVALVVAELMSDAASDAGQASDESDAGPASPGTVPQSSEGTPSASLAAAPSSEPSGPIRPLLLSVTGGLAKGMGAEELLAGTVDADLVMMLGDSGLRLTPSAGFVYMPTRNDETWRKVSFTGAVARLLAGLNWGLLDLAGGPFVARYSIDGATPHAGTLFGAEALARIAAPVSRHARLVVGTRVHAYGNRVRVAWADGTGYATPRLELTIGVGLAWDWSS